MNLMNGRSLRCAILLSLATGVTAVSCGSDGDGNSAAALGEDDTFCAELASATCGWARNCCELTELQGILGLDPSDPYSIELVRKAQADSAACYDVVHAGCVTAQRDLLESMRTKRVNVDRAHFNECIAEYQRASTACDVGIRTGPTFIKACKLSDIITGNAQENDACFHTLDCADGLFCWRPAASPGAGEGRAGAGICRPVVTQGQACRESTTCEESSVCTPVETRTSKCAPIDRQQDGAFCTDDALCLPGSFCNTLEFRCEPKRKGAEECNRSNHCLSARCNRDERKCEPQRASGDRCSSHGECQDGLWCNPAHAASFCSRPLDTGSAGDACDANTPCETGLICVGGTCQAPRPQGELCSLDTQCSEDSYCDKSKSVCTGPRKQAAATCTNSRECGVDLYCSFVGFSGTCQPRVKLSETCASTGADSCVGGARCNPVTRLCEPALSADAPCVAANDCQTGLICETFAGRCDQRLPAGSACNDAAACPANEYCSTSSAKSVCEVVPLAGEAEACVSDASCTAGLYCATSFPRTCQRRRPANDTCTDTSRAGKECSDGLYCDALSLKCTALGIVSSPCSSSKPCAADLYCTSTVSGTCRKSAKVSELCSSFASDTNPMCGAGLQCQAGAETSTCVLLDTGKPCSTVTGCAPGFFCDASTFSPICAPVVQAGKPCTAANQCAEGLSCDLLNTGTCVAPKTAGQECPDGQCATGLACHAFSGTCTARTALGESCLLDEQCGTGSECLAQSTCEARVQLDKECDADHPCAPGLRCDAEWGVCKPLATPALKSGERCHVDEDCMSGSCVEHICTGLCQGVGR